jgi:hypothetical protein
MGLVVWGVGMLASLIATVYSLYRISVGNTPIIFWILAVTFPFSVAGCAYFFIEELIYAFKTRP